jgi:hypothetical protein
MRHDILSAAMRSRAPRAGSQTSFRSVEILGIEPAFAQAQNDHVDGVVVAGSMSFDERAHVGASALAHRMPAMALFRKWSRTDF